jgi:hypothetical protein
VSEPLTVSWTALLVLGAAHGLNPAMGWLLAVARGMQERRGGAVWRTLPPLAAGHATAVGIAAALAATIGLVVPLHHLRWGVAAVLIGFGLRRLRRARHPRFGGMCVGARDLAVWSLLMASAHGAGVMILPLLLPASGPTALHAAHAAAHGNAAVPPGVLLAATLHTAAYLATTGAVAALVYYRLGLRLLRPLWVNVDRVWAGALIVTGVLTPLL